MERLKEYAEQLRKELQGVEEKIRAGRLNSQLSTNHKKEGNEIEIVGKSNTWKE